MTSKTKKATGTTIATDEGVVIAEQRHVEVTDNDQVYEAIVAVSCLPEIRAAFKDHDAIMTATEDPKIRSYGGSTVAVVHLPLGDVEMIAHHLVEIGGRPFAAAGRGLHRRIERGLRPVNPDGTKGKGVATKATTSMVGTTDFRTGYQDALVAFDENTNDPTTLDSLKDAERFYRDLVQKGAATDYARGMAAGLAQRLA